MCPTDGNKSPNSFTTIVLDVYSLFPTKSFHLFLCHYCVPLLPIPSTYNVTVTLWWSLWSRFYGRYGHDETTFTIPLLVKSGVAGTVVFVTVKMKRLVEIDSLLWSL